MFASHRITTTGIGRKTIEEKRYLQRRRVSQTRGMQNQIERFRRIKKGGNEVHSRKQRFFTIGVPRTFLRA